MALNEITKGMSNAAELINANFLTGSIIETGSNTRGKYIKFSNGFMVCMMDKLINNLPITTLTGNKYYSEVITLEYPEPFYSRPYVPTPGLSSARGKLVWASDAISTTDVKGYVSSDASANPTVTIVSGVAFGLWKEIETSV